MTVALTETVMADVLLGHSICSCVWWQFCN